MFHFGFFFSKIMRSCTSCNVKKDRNGVLVYLSIYHVEMILSMILGVLNSRKYGNFDQFISHTIIHWLWPFQ